MQIEAIDTLTGLRAALEAPADRRLDIFRSQVMEPLRPYWEPMLAYAAPKDQAEPGDPALAAARAFGYYTPDLGAESGLRALDQLAAARAWPQALAALQQAKDALAPEAHGVPLDRVRFSLVLANPAFMRERTGSYSGFGGWPGLTMVIVWPTDFNLPRLPSAAIHELHHNVRLRFEPWSEQTTVGQYIVLEGLAEAFVAEQHGEAKVGPWARALSPEQIAALRPRFRENLTVAGYDQIRGYLFGDWAAEAMGFPAQGLPDFAGFTVGYELVRAYCTRTGRTVVEATYVPWQEIVEEARYL